MAPPIRLALIHGSARRHRFGETVMAWAQSVIARQQGLDTEIVDPREYFSFAESDAPTTTDLSVLKQRLERADAFIVVTPEYNHGYPAALKTLIDSAYSEWNAKPAGFISYGGMSGGIRAVEQLRQVFAELHVVTMRDGVSFANVWDQFDRHGKLLHAPRAEKAMETMLSQLRWWANALRAARAAQSYREVVE
ncbi:MAG: NADPH-dependent FMN reductase [Burkholderiaceae bacterium]